MAEVTSLIWADRKETEAALFGYLSHNIDDVTEIIVNCAGLWSHTKTLQEMEIWPDYGFGRKW